MNVKDKPKAEKILETWDELDGLALIEALAERLREAEAALGFYASDINWIREGIVGLGLQSKRRSVHESDVSDVGGKRAREYFAKWGEK